MTPPPLPFFFELASTVAPGPTLREKARDRTRELGRIAGRPFQQISQQDYEQARRELTGESDPDRQDAILDRVA